MDQLDLEHVSRNNIYIFCDKFNKNIVTYTSTDISASATHQVQNFQLYLRLNQANNFLL